MSMPGRFTNILIAFVVVAAAVSLSARAVSVARSKERDAIRFASLRATQTALEQRFFKQNSYPLQADVPLGDSASAVCLDETGFAPSCTSGITYLRYVLPALSQGLSPAVQCGVPPRPGFCYSVRAEGASYGIQFESEQGWPDAGISRGVNCATEEGFRPGACPR
ncbi:hypothetical protein HYV73_04585 [Candidatus Uhrbacteria bacterium]|nr:hypothetical protein [Candidatus Uhrbacteria bacterium]